MKTMLVLFVLVVISTGTSLSQGTLQFNRVVLIEAGSGVQSVPASKVWKLTAATSYSQIVTSSRPSIVNINGVANHFGYRGQDGNGQPFTSAAAAFPFWLPAGTTVELPTNSTAGFRALSAIEFNTVP